MKRKVFKAIGSIIGACAMVFSMLPVNAYAYTKNEYNYKDGYYYVDNSASHTQDNSITLYLLFPKDSFLEGDIYYDFECFSDNFPDGSYYKEMGSELLRFHEKLDTAKTVAEDVGEGVVLSFKFNVENGIYAFSTNDYSYGICTLTSDYKNPLEHKRNFADSTTVWKEKITLNNEHLDLYAIMGGEDFILNNIDAMSAYAKGLRESELTTGQKENNMRDILSEMVSDDTDKNELNLLVKELMDENNTESSTEINKNLDVDKDASNDTGVTVTVNSGTKPEEPADTNKQNPVQKWILIIGGVVVLTVLFIVSRKGKKKTQK